MIKKTYPIVNKLYPSIDEFDCPWYKCKDCKYFKFVLPGDSPSGCSHRFDHNKMDYAAPWFKDVPEADGHICSDFEPDGSYPAALPYWHGYEHWREWCIKQKEEEYSERGKKFIPKSDEECLIGFRLKQAPHEFYYVRLSDYVNNTMWEGNKLKAVLRKYYKNHKKKDKYDLGFDLITEEIDGVIVE